MFPSRTRRARSSSTASRPGSKTGCTHGTASTVRCSIGARSFLTIVPKRYVQLREGVSVHAECARRAEEWKYIRYPHGDGTADRHLAELYNLKTDPEERVNLIADPASAGVLAELKAELARVMAASGLNERTDRMPVDAGIKKTLPDQRIR